MTEDFDDHIEEVERSTLADPGDCAAPEAGTNDIPAVSAEVHEDVLAVGRKPLKVDLAVLDSYIQELVLICAQKGVCSINRKWIADNNTRFYSWLLKRMTQRKGQKNLHPLWYRLRKLLADRNIVLDLNLPPSEKTREQEGVHSVVRGLLKANLPEWIPDTLKEVARTDHRYFTGKYNTPHGVRWSCLVSQLPQQLQSLFVYPRYNEALFEHYPEEKALYVRGRRSALQRDLKKALAGKNPPSFDTAWMEDNAGYTYRNILELAQIDPGFSWWGFIKELGDGWIEKYKRRFSFKDESTNPKARAPGF